MPRNSVVPTTDPDRLLSLREVATMLGLSRVSVWQLRRSGSFPTGRRLTTNRLAWLRSDLLAWIESRPAVQ
jgi:prophage regulatory protein